MISLKTEDYCHNCEDFEPHVEKLVSRTPLNTVTICETIITCEHECRCQQIKNYLEKSTKTREVHIKSDETCKTCVYMVWSGSECRKYDICHTDCKNYCEAITANYGRTLCKCLTVNIGDPCPYYKPENKEGKDE